ncbi:chloroperoxidase [Streptomyces sp. AcH 505]|uniref:alpha/beta fold hydrolase n=1 Tax=Streptomyces sp. AcH 505 TaxID=352211 RepID=UPI0005918E47|nr:chloroperoxidase [Streptomyces sp. AcH 505]
MPYFTTPTDDTRLHYIDHGPRNGPTTVFLSSSYLGSEMWERQTVPLAEAGHRCVGIDRRGHGRSDDVWDGFDLDTLATDVAALLDLLDLREVTLVGHSMGGVEAVRYLTRYGGRGRVARLALVASIAPGLAASATNPDGMTPAELRASSDWFRRDRLDFFESGADSFFASHLPGNEVSPAYVRHMVGRCALSTLRAGLAMQDIGASVDLTPELPEIGLPALVLHGTHDTSAPIEFTGRRSAELLPDATLRVYENGGHGMFATHAARLTADLRSFADGVLPA